MKKNIIRLTESELKKLIRESVKSIIAEANGYNTEYISVDLCYVDFDNEELGDFLDSLDETPDQVSCELEYSIEEYDKGDYWTPPSGGYADIVDWSIDTDGVFKNILPPELYEIFIQSVSNYISNNTDAFAESIYDGYENYGSDYERYDD